MILPSVCVVLGSWYVNFWVLFCKLLGELLKQIISGLYGSLGEESMTMGVVDAIYKVKYFFICQQKHTGKWQEHRENTGNLALIGTWQPWDIIGTFHLPPCLACYLIRVLCEELGNIRILWEYGQFSNFCPSWHGLAGRLWCHEYIMRWLRSRGFQSFQNIQTFALKLLSALSRLNNKRGGIWKVLIRAIFSKKNCKESPTDKGEIRWFPYELIGTNGGSNHGSIVGSNVGNNHSNMQKSTKIKPSWKNHTIFEENPSISMSSKIFVKIHAVLWKLCPIAHVPHPQGPPSLSLVLTNIPLYPCALLPMCPITHVPHCSCVKKMSSCQKDVKCQKV